jgi:amino acid adenylation domain-containing protein
MTMTNSPARARGQECAHGIFEERVRLSGEAPALVAGGEQLSYGEVNRRANQVAHYLRRLGVGPDTLVAVCQERSAEMVIAVLAVLKAGGAYVPLDPAYPRERLRIILEDAAVSVLLTRTDLLERLPVGLGPRPTPKAVCLDRDWPAISRESEENPVSVTGADSLAYVVYTSGSTGRPKGVMVEHRGLVNLAEAQVEVFERGPSDRILQFASLSFDASIFEFLMAWRVGACLYLGSSEEVMAGAALAGMLRENAITTLTIPPSVLAGLPDEEFPALGAIIVAGEACPPEVVRRWAPGRRFWNAYGPTEITVWATVAECSPGPAGPPIGRAIANARTYVLGPDLRPVAPGQAGELCVGGVGVSRGYLGRPDLTAEKFLPDPFEAEAGGNLQSERSAGGRLYRTGDLVRLGDDGELEFLGRVDHQVKVRGFRVEPGEIEAALFRHPGVETAVVIARQDGAGPRRLVAYVVSSGLLPPSVGDLRASLKKLLPEHMIPASFVILAALPLLPNGKVDRSALPAPEALRPDLDEPYLAPRTPSEARLAAIWAEVLGLPRVGVRDDLFALGGDSLLATQIAARIKRSLDVGLPLRTIFSNPTVAGLAAVLDEDRPAGPSEFPPIRPQPRDGRAFPLSLSQERVWFLQELEPGNLSYNAQATLTFEGDLDVPVLEAALTEIVRRHEIFRTVFSLRDGRPLGEIQAPWAVALPIIDITSVPLPARRRELDRLVQEIIRRPFDPRRLPLARWSLVRVGPQEHVLVHSEHHLLHDGWSFGVFLREVKILYEAFLAGEPSPLPDLEIQFADYATWQREWAESEVVASQLEYWKTQLAGSPPLLDLPTDRPRPAVQSFRGASVRRQLPEDLSKALAHLARREGATLYMTLLTVFAGLLHRYSRQSDFCLGAGLANRRWPEIENVIGMVINTVALRLVLEGNPNFGQLLERVRRVTLEAQDNQDIPFDRVVETLRPERSLSHLPIYQAVFAFHDSPMPEFELAGATMRIAEALNNGSAKFDLSVVGIPRSERQSAAARAAGAEQITLVWEYSTDLFDEATICRMAGHYERLLRAVADDPSCPLAEIDLLGPEERVQLLSDWNATQTGRPRDVTVHQLVREQAERTPKAEAVVFGGQSLTYRELGRRAGALATRLRELGAGAETVVAVLVERGLHLVPALLACLEAGSAYLPLDPALPKERLGFLLADSGAGVVITQGSLLGRLPETAAVPVLDLDPFWAGDGRAESVREATPGGSGDPVPSPAPDRDVLGVRPDNLAYVIYTSGSTGRPKGVMVEHRSVVNLISWHKTAFGIGPGERASQVAGLGFDAAVWEIWPYLASGASIHLVEDDDTRLSPEAIRNWLLERRITVAFLPTPLAEAVLGLSWPATTSLRLLLTGGDRLRIYPPDGLPFVLVNNYGPTENTVVTTYGVAGPKARPPVAEARPPVSEAPEGGGVAPSIGRPVDNNRVYLLDPFLRPAPTGGIGELCVAGESLSRGYLARPDLTAEVFVPDPFATEPGGRLYRTGDLARYLPDGRITFIGRRDHQVKIRGFRVELGEIEANLLGHPSVGQVVVEMKDEGRPAGGRLVAYLTRAPGHELRPEELRSFLGERLGEYMVPAVFVEMTALPVDAGGKVDRRALPIPAEEVGDEEAYQPPRTPIEERLVAIWQEVLGLSQVGVGDSFFSLGGHSLMATQIISRIREVFGLEVPLRSVFSTPTIEGLAGAIETLLLGAADEAGLAQLLDEVEGLSQ